MSSIVPESSLSVAQIMASLRGIEPLASRTYPSQPTRGLGFSVKDYEFWKKLSQ